MPRQRDGPRDRRVLSKGPTDVGAYLDKGQLQCEGLGCSTTAGGPMSSQRHHRGAYGQMGIRKAGDGGQEGGGQRFEWPLEARRDREGTVPWGPSFLGKREVSPTSLSPASLTVPRLGRGEWGRT